MYHGDRIDVADGDIYIYTYIYMYIYIMNRKNVMDIMDMTGR